MKSLLLAALFMVISGTAYSQSASIWKHFLRPDVALDVYFYSLAESDTAATNDLDSRSNLLHLGASVGLNLPFVEIADDFTAGLNPNIGITSSISAMTPILTLEVPIYATLKYNTDATWAGSKGVVGLSAGIGYHHAAFVFVESGTVVDFGMPTFMAELNFGKRRSSMGLIKLRYTSSIGSHTELFPDDNGGQDGQIVFTRSAFHLLFTPGY